MSNFCCPQTAALEAEVTGLRARLDGELGLLRAQLEDLLGAAVVSPGGSGATAATDVPAGSAGAAPHNAAATATGGAAAQGVVVLRGGGRPRLDDMARRLAALEASNALLAEQLRRQSRLQAVAVHVAASLSGLAVIALRCSSGGGGTGFGVSEDAAAVGGDVGAGGGGACATGMQQQQQQPRRPPVWDKLQQLRVAVAGMALANGAVAALLYVRS